MMESLLLGLEREKAGKLNEALAFCTKAMDSLRGKESSSPPFCHFVMARILLKRGHEIDRRDAIEHLKLTIEGNPNHMLAATMLAELEPAKDSESPPVQEETSQKLLSLLQSLTALERSFIPLTCSVTDQTGESASTHVVFEGKGKAKRRVLRPKQETTKHVAKKRKTKPKKEKGEEEEGESTRKEEETQSSRSMRSRKRKSASDTAFVYE